MSFKSFVRDIKDFPKPGIVFKDITPLLSNPTKFNQLINLFFERYKNQKINAIAGIEARGFIFGSSLAYKLQKPFIPIRKKGKLPYKTISHTYDLEYGTDTIEVHADAVKPGDRVLIIDDLLATGGTSLACANMFAKLDAEVVELAFVIELLFLKGKEKLKDYNVYSVIQY